jgi:alpha-mannosidase
MIDHIDIVNLSHYDIGFTDHPLVCRLAQTRFLDQALELIADNPRRPADRRFSWTCESNNAVLDWWLEASPERREALLQAVAAGWLEVCAAPFNCGPTMDARQWSRCARWLPPEIRKRVPLRTIVQNDVNGMARAGVMAMMAEGAEFLWMGLNTDTGASPVPQPSAFWWEMPDGRRIMVMNTVTYPSAFFLFEETEWRRGPLPLLADARYRPPRRGDFFATSPEELSRAHALCHAQIERWQSTGCRLGRVALSMTNMWRIDNDPPCEMLPDFIAAWNAAGLRPSLRLTTPSVALEAIRADHGDTLPTLSGEWVSWWANGDASTPRELSASRRAKRLIEALGSPLYPQSALRAKLVDRCLRDLSFFDEHTWGSWNSAAMPDCQDTKGQFAEKAVFAYRPAALAELEIGDANRILAPTAQGVHVVNPFPAPYSGWVELTDDCLRGGFEGLCETASGAEQRFDIVAGPAPFFVVPHDAAQFTAMDRARVFPDNVPGKRMRFWVEDLGPNGVRSYRLLARVGAPAVAPALPVIEVDALGWPRSARWGSTVLFQSAIGDFISLEVRGLAPRWAYKDIMDLPSLTERRRARDERAAVVAAEPAGAAAVRDTGPTIVYEQYLRHPRLGRARRTLEVYKGQPRARLTLLVERLPKPESAEVFTVHLPLDRPRHDLVVTNGGVPYRPGREQLPGSCQDFHAVDDRLRLTAGTSTITLETLDAALVELGGINDGLRIPGPPDDPSDVYVVVYNNVWYTNYAGDESGIMEFAFDLHASADASTRFSPQAFAVIRV